MDDVRSLDDPDDGRSQRERMLAGDLYQAWEPSLEEDRRICRTRTDVYDRSGHLSAEERLGLLRGMLGAVGDGCEIVPPFRCDYGTYITIGERSFVNTGAIMLDCAPITIGSEVLLAGGVQLLAATHPLDAATRRAGWELALPITIGDGAWLGGGVIVCPGVTIGENTVVGAGSVVVKELPAGVLAVGNPARIVREL